MGGLHERRQRRLLACLAVVTEKRQRQKAGHHARLNAERAALERARRRRRVGMVALVLVAAIVAVPLLAVLSNDSTSSTTATSTTASTTTTDPRESAAGKPCVALADPLPVGAPEVPVPVGAPPTELVSEDLVVGSGEPAELGEQITVGYTGVSCSTGKIFESSYSQGQPATFPLEEGSLIKGWTDAIPGMRPGGQRLVVIPPELGYGATGNAKIAPDETLVFVIELDAAAPATTTGP